MKAEDIMSCIGVLGILFFGMLLETADWKKWLCCCMASAILILIGEAIKNVRQAA